MTTKGKTPIVKMNLASKLRMERSNPYIYYKKQLEILSTSKYLNASQISNPLNNTMKDKTSLNKSMVNTNKKPANVPNKICSTARKVPNDTNNKNATTKTFKPPVPTNKLKSDAPKNTNLTNKSTILQTRTIVTQNYKPVPEKPKLTLNTNKKSSVTNVNDRRLTVLQKRNTVSENKPVPSKLLLNVNKNVQAVATVTDTELHVRKSRCEFNKTQNNEIKKSPRKIERRSLSAVYFKKIKTKDMNSFRTKSVERLTEINQKVDIRTPIREEPEFLQRRSIIRTTPGTIRKSIFTPPAHLKNSTTAQELQNRLNSWLEKRGKPRESFHHLKCFGVLTLPPVTEFNEEDKENFESVNQKSESYENLHIIPLSEKKKSTEDLFVIAKDALYDLHKLILEGYPRESCESWLHLIKSKFHELEEQPQYWECRAALEEIRGNFSSAVDCYQKAIIKGAEVKDVDDSLEHLLQKFSVLNLSPEPNGIANNNPDKKKRKTILDARNVFKSSIINFAIQKRSVKKKPENVDSSFQFLATPVRRSTRLSRTNFTSTPGLTVCTTLKNLDESTRESLFFKSNKAIPS